MKVIIISGPTATGKTDLAVELALKYQGEIVNFDSLLLYQEITIGTAKPDALQRKLIPHHMIDVRSINNPMNAADYSREAYPIIESIGKKNKIVFIVGGSGFYLQALMMGMYDSVTSPQEILDKSELLYKTEGISPFIEILKNIDPKSYERYHENDHYRIRRAVEHFWTTGNPFSSAREKKDQTNSIINSQTLHNWDVLHIHLDLPKVFHQKIIEQRTDRMIKEGLIDEVKNLLKAGFTGEEKPLQSIGYKETIKFIRGCYKDDSDYREAIIISTRQLAKAQRTWFKRNKFKITKNPLEERDEIFLQVENFIRD